MVVGTALSSGSRLGAWFLDEAGGCVVIPLVFLILSSGTENMNLESAPLKDGGGFNVFCSSSSVFSIISCAVIVLYYALFRETVGSGVVTRLIELIVHFSESNLSQA